MQLRRDDADKVTETLAKLLYEHLFRQVLSIVNEKISFGSPKFSVGILDIAGFGKLNIFHLQIINILFYLLLCM